MGAVMRRYWIPVLLREEIPDPDGDPCASGFWARTSVAIVIKSGRIVYTEDPSLPPPGF
jgi:hypothetical protein